MMVADEKMSRQNSQVPRNINVVPIRSTGPVGAGVDVRINE